MLFVKSLVSNINSMEFFEETPSLKKHGPNGVAVPHQVALMS